MGVQKRTRKFAQVKRVIGQRDARLKKNQLAADAEQAKKKAKPDDVVREVPQVSSSLFFQYNTSLTRFSSIPCAPFPAIHTAGLLTLTQNFLSHTVQRKLELLPAMMDCLYAKCTPVITSCVMAELEKLGPKYRIALRIARDERWERLQCDHKGVYADDCIVDRVQKHKVYIVATNDMLPETR
ncbi:rRNA-processing protein fcf1 [Neofusicoccum parvum]|nr:rRNA-processing protein fcf1 [Neofusicoccum parvum]